MKDKFDALPPVFFKHQAELQKAQHLRDNPVVEVFQALVRYVKEFEAGLDQNHETGALLTSFGSSIQIHVNTIEYTKPSIITFTGVTSSNDKVRLIQHVSQLSFLLISVETREEKPWRVGFVKD